MRLSGIALDIKRHRRSGMTLMEVLLAMGIFLIGSVSLVGLFVTASALHADAMNRRRASFIANELLASVRGLSFREVFAKTEVVSDAGTDITAATVPTSPYWAANFSVYPLHYLLNPSTDPNNPIAGRTSGPILIEGEAGTAPVAREWAWYTGAAGITFTIPAGNRWLWSSAGGAGTHSPGRRILEPRSWRYVLAGTIDNATGTIPVKGDPTAVPAAPPSGYIVVDEEWMPYGQSDPPTPPDQFNFYVDVGGRGWGSTKPVAHLAGTPVTVAREHPYYPGFYYTVQFYPADATGASAQVIITVGYGNQNFFRVHTFHTIYAPASY